MKPFQMNGQSPSAMKQTCAGEVVVAESLRLAMKLLYDRQDASDELFRRVSEHYTADVALLRQQYQQLAERLATNVTSLKQQNRKLEEATIRRSAELRRLFDETLSTCKTSDLQNQEWRQALSGTLEDFMKRVAALEASGGSNQSQLAPTGAAQASRATSRAKLQMHRNGNSHGLEIYHQNRQNVSASSEPNLDVFQRIHEGTEERQHRNSSRHSQIGLVTSTTIYRHASDVPLDPAAATDHQPATSGPLFPQASHGATSALEESLDIPRKTNVNNQPSAISPTIQVTPDPMGSISASIVKFAPPILRKRPASAQCQRPAANLSKSAKRDIVSTVRRAQPGHQVRPSHETSNIVNVMRLPSRSGQAPTMQNDAVNTVDKNKQTQARMAKTTANRAPKPMPQGKPAVVIEEAAVRPRTRAGWKAINEELAVDVHKYVNDRCAR